VLLRKEVPFLDTEEEKNDEYQPVVVAHQIESLEFSYSADGIKFVDDWDVTSQNNLNKLPELIKIKLKLKDADGREEYFETLIDLPMTEDINVKAQAPTTPAPGTTPAKTPTSPNSKSLVTPPAKPPSNVTPGGQPGG
jgi:hypothetical protein